jgi:hypothetical protein
MLRFCTLLCVLYSINSFGYSCIDLIQIITVHFGNPYYGQKLTAQELNHFQLNPNLITEENDVDTFLINLGGRNRGIFRFEFDGHKQPLMIKRHASNEQRDIEIQKMKNLSEWHNEDSSPLEKFKFLEYEDTHHFSSTEHLKVQNIYGKDLSLLLLSPLVSHNAGNMLIKMYELKAANYNRIMRKKGFVRNKDVLNENTHFYFHPAGAEPRAIHDETGYYFLKPNQVIVDTQTLEMWVVDPF